LNVPDIDFILYRLPLWMLFEGTILLPN